jgi:hypothetical protein
LARPFCIDSPIATKRSPATSSKAFRIKQSRLWFWRELIGAILTGAFRRSIEVRPIKLVDFPSLHRCTEDFAAKRIRLQTLGLSASPVSGISGWTIVTLIADLGARDRPCGSCS